MSALTNDPDLFIVFPSRAGTGLRHGVIRGEDRALCGRNVDGFYPDMGRTACDSSTIGCKQCSLAYKKREGKTP